MKISAIEEYGLRIIVSVAKLVKVSTSGLASLHDIAQQEGISVENTAAILTKLREADLIESVRGKFGGYKLKKASKEINLYQVIAALSKETFSLEFCDSHSGLMDSCVHISNCSLRPVWSNLGNLVNNYLASISLDQLLADESSCSFGVLDGFGVLKDFTEKNLIANNE